MRARRVVVAAIVPMVAVIVWLALSSEHLELPECDLGDGAVAGAGCGLDEFALWEAGEQGRHACQGLARGGVLDRRFGPHPGE